MKTRIASLSPILLSAAMFAGGLRHSKAGEEYVLAKKSYTPPPGTILTTETSMSMDNAVLTFVAGDHEIAGSAIRSQSQNDTMEILDSHRIRYICTGKQSKNEMAVNGKVQNTPEKPYPLLKKTVILERKDGMWAAYLEDHSEPDAATRKELDSRAKKMNKDMDFKIYGEAPRKVGDEWNADPSTTDLCGEGNTTGSFTLKFLEVKEIGGEKCAILKNHL